LPNVVSGHPGSAVFWRRGIDKASHASNHAAIEATPFGHPSSPDRSVTARDTVAAVCVAVVWGLSFIAIKIGVGETSPLMLSALRFVFAALPAVLFIAPPKAAVWKMALYGLLLGMGQFGLLFIAIREGFPVGLASLVIQAQAFFTVALAWLLLSEWPRRTQVLAGLVAFAGLAVIGSARLAGAAFGPFLLVVLASFFWGSANLLAKTVGKVDMLAFTVWSSLAAPLPLLVLSLSVDGSGPLLALAHPSWRLAASVLIVAYAGTVFGFGLWARLLARYSAATVAPFALLTPVVGMLAGAIVFGEPLRPVELAGGVLVMAGLALNMFGDWRLRRRALVLR
jgi:O-acetylserine/cysteine efflux transporter